MTFMQEAAANTDAIWKQCAEESFLTEMGKGTLSRQKFLEYIIQDSLYLRDYVKAYAMALFKSRTLKEMKAFYSVLGYVNDSENVTRLKYLTDSKLTDEDIETREKNPACKAYTKFLLDYAVHADIPEILMALMPCMVGYYEVFRLVRVKYPEVLNSYFGKLVEDYTSDRYKESCNAWINFTGSICENLSSERKGKLKDIYLQSSMLELYFWQMVSRDR